MVKFWKVSAVLLLLALAGFLMLGDKLLRRPAMDKSQFERRFFGMALSTNVFRSDFTNFSAVGGFAGIARVSGPRSDVELLLSKCGVRELQMQDGVGPLLKSRIVGIAKEGGLALIPITGFDSDFLFESMTVSNGLYEFYVSTNLDQFVFIVIVR
jgi:hypothetical protein